MQGLRRKVAPKVASADGDRLYLDWFRRRYPEPEKLLEPQIENWTEPSVY